MAREAVALRQLRREVMGRMNWSLRDLCRTLDEPGANPLRAAQEVAAPLIIPSGLPLPVEAQAGFVTSHCISVGL